MPIYIAFFAFFDSFIFRSRVTYINDIFRGTPSGFHSELSIAQKEVHVNKNKEKEPLFLSKKHKNLANVMFWKNSGDKERETRIIPIILIVKQAQTETAVLVEF